MSAGADRQISRGLHASWAEVPEHAVDGWRWRFFSAKELSCKCGGRHCRGEYFHNPEFLDALERLRIAAGRPLVVTSGRRCRGHNAAVKGASRSQHMLAIAVDISLFGHDRQDIVNAALKAGFTGIGFGSSFLHLDWRPTRTAFHYPNARGKWTILYGFDPVRRLTETWGPL